MAAEKAEATLRDSARQQQALDAAIGRLGAEETALRQSVEGFTKKLSSLRMDFEARSQPRVAELAELDRQIAEKKHQLVGLKAELEALRSRLTV